MTSRIKYLTPENAAITSRLPRQIRGDDVADFRSQIFYATCQNVLIGNGTPDEIEAACKWASGGSDVRSRFETAPRGITDWQKERLIKQNIDTALAEQASEYRFNIEKSVTDAPSKPEALKDLLRVLQPIITQRFENQPSAIRKEQLASLLLFRELTELFLNKIGCKSCSASFAINVAATNPSELAIAEERIKIGKDLLSQVISRLRTNDLDLSEKAITNTLIERASYFTEDQYLLPRLNGSGQAADMFLFLGRRYIDGGDELIQAYNEIANETLAVLIQTTGYKGSEAPLISSCEPFRPSKRSRSLMFQPTFLKRIDNSEKLLTAESLRRSENASCAYVNQVGAPETEYRCDFPSFKFSVSTNIESFVSSQIEAATDQSHRASDANILGEQAALKLKTRGKPVIGEGGLIHWNIEFQTDVQKANDIFLVYTIQYRSDSNSMSCANEIIASTSVIGPSRP